MRDFGEAPPPETFFDRLKSGLSRSTAGLSDSLTGIFTKRPLDKDTVAEFEEALIRADLGAAFAAKLAAHVANGRYDTLISTKEVR
ncbi:MAG TPA: signal recognition particle receptor subunit alpha, partial [Rhizomicrobium sp.]